MADVAQPDPRRRVRDRFIQGVKDDDVSGLSAEIAYRFLFAVFPFGLFVAALGSFVAVYFRIDNPADEAVRALGDNLPPSIADAIRPELRHLLTSARPDLVSIGALAALWAATGGINAVVKGMDLNSPPRSVALTLPARNNTAPIDMNSSPLNRMSAKACATAPFSPSSVPSPMPTTMKPSWLLRL